MKRFYKKSNLKFEDEVEDFYWYCLTKNLEYRADFDFFKNNMIPILSMTPIYSESKSCILIEDPLYNIDSLLECLSTGVGQIDACDEYLDDLHHALATYYAFLIKWRVYPTDYVHENRDLGRKISNIKEKRKINILKLKQIVIPRFIDMNFALIEYPEIQIFEIAGNHCSEKQAEQELKNQLECVDSIQDQYIQKKRNKNTSLIVYKRSLVCFNDLLCSKVSEKEILKKKKSARRRKASKKKISTNFSEISSLLSKLELYIYGLEEMVCIDHIPRNLSTFNFTASGWLDSGKTSLCWPEKTIEVYRNSGLVFDTENVDDMNKIRSLRSKEFKIAVQAIYDPFSLLSYFSNNF